MPPFAFETLLNQRIHQEEIIQKEMAVFSRTLSEERQTLEQLENDQNRALNEIQHKQNDGITASEQVLYMNYLDGMTSRIRTQKESIQQAKTQLDLKRLELLDAVKKRKMLEQLKEKSQKCYREKERKLEQNLLDEAAVCRFEKNGFITS